MRRHLLSLTHENVQMTYTVRAELLNTRDDGAGNTYRFCQHTNQHHCVTFFPLIAIYYVFRLKQA